MVRLSPETGEREIVLMRWGLVPFWARDARDGVKRINARAESIVPEPLVEVLNCGQTLAEHREIAYADQNVSCRHLHVTGMTPLCLRGAKEQ
jgi:hypothetical protein